MSETKAKETTAMSLDNMEVYTEQLRENFVQKEDLPAGEIRELTAEEIHALFAAAKTE